MVGNQFESRDIKIMKRNNAIQTIQGTYCSYNVLQYTLVFWEGEDGNHIYIKQ